MKGASFVLIGVVGAILVWQLGSTTQKPAAAPRAQGIVAQASSAAVTLTYSMTANQRFSADVVGALNGIGKRAANRLCMPLLPGHHVNPPGSCPDVADQKPIIHVVVIRNGVMWRFFSTHPWAFEKAASLGSVSKAVLGIPMLARSGAVLGEQWCQERFADFRNFNGFRGYTDCESRAARISDSAALRTSDNLATIYRLRRLPSASIRTRLLELGVKNVPADYHPGIAVGAGIVELSPRQAIETFEAFSSGEARRVAVSDGATAQPSSLSSWAAETVSDLDRRQYIHALLRAPVEPSGTAHHLRRILPSTVTGLMAKTGTPVNAESLDTGKLLLATFQHNGHRFTFLTAVLSPRPSAPLSPRLNGSDFAPLHSVIAAHLD